MFSTSEIGTHSELLSAVGLVANHFVVARPLSVESYDLVILDPRDNRWKTAQVKTAYERTDRPTPAVVVFAKKKDGTPYGPEVDVFLAVYKNQIFMFDNKYQTEYWATPDNIHEKWELLSHKLER
ncbi:MAG: hypothetical protein ACQEUT_18440 [Bacillota bacterium]